MATAFPTSGPEEPAGAADPRHAERLRGRAAGDRDRAARHEIESRCNRRAGRRERPGAVPRARAADSCRSIPSGCISDWRGQAAAHVKIAWPSGAAEEASGLEPGYVYTFVEGSSERGAHAVPPAEGCGRPRLLRGQERAGVRRYLAAGAGAHARSPDGQGRGGIRGAARRREPPKMPPGVPCESIDLRAEKADVAAAYSLFRRYLFEYRTGSGAAAGAAGGWREPRAQGLCGYSLGGGHARRPGAHRRRAARWRFPSPASII